MLGDLTDTDLLAEAASEADAVIHLASPGDATSATVDAGVVEAFLLALHGTGKAYLHTSGIWTHGDGSDLTETTPFAPPELTAWRLPLDARVLDAAKDGVRSVVITPGIVYGHGARPRQPDPAGPTYRGRHASRTRAPATSTGRRSTSTTSPRSTSRPSKRRHRGSYYLAVSGDNPTVREIALTVADRVEAEPAEQTQARLGRDCWAPSHSTSRPAATRRGASSAGSPSSRHCSTSCAADPGAMMPG